MPYSFMTKLLLHAVQSKDKMLYCKFSKVTQVVFSGSYSHICRTIDPCSVPKSSYTLLITHLLYPCSYSYMQLYSLLHTINTVNCHIKLLLCVSFSVL